MTIEFDDNMLMFLNCINDAYNLLPDQKKNLLIGCNSILDLLGRNIKEYGSDSECYNKIDEVVKKIITKLSEILLDEGPDEEIKKIISTIELDHMKHEQLLYFLGDDWYRDHYNHSKRNYWLGILLSRYIKKYQVTEENINLWYLIARLHDYGYIVQEVNALTKNTSKLINESFKGMNFKLDTKISIGDYYTKQKQLEIIKDMNLFTQNDLKTSYLSMLEQIDKNVHSVISSLFIVDFFHHNNLYNEILSERDLMKISRAIALHELSFTQPQIYAETDFLASLLILVDELQEWGRSKGTADKPIIPHLDLDSIEICYKQPEIFKNIMDLLIYNPGKISIPAQYVTDDPYDNIEWNLVRAGDEKEYFVYLEITLTPGAPLDSEIEDSDIENELKIRATIEATNFMYYLSTLMESIINIPISDLFPEHIINGEKSKDKIVLQYPLIYKTKYYPLIVNETLLMSVITYIIEVLYDFNKNKPKYIYKNKTPLFKYKIPEPIADFKIKKKQESLLRINHFNFDWCVEYYAKFINKEELTEIIKIFPISPEQLMEIQDT